MADKPKPPAFTAGQLESLCKALADTVTGLSGTEIGAILMHVRVADADPNATKWKRLYRALASRQNADGHGDRILSFIKNALDPVRYRGREDVFQLRRQSANVALAFYGMELTEEAKFRRCGKATTIGEAEGRADRMRQELERRKVEPEVLEFCRAELLAKNYFHAVLEATKSVAVAIRQKASLEADGAALTQEAFGGSDPILRINDLRDDTARSEQRGFTNLLVGFFGTFRNPTAHAPKIEYPINEQDALDLLTLASMIYRRIKRAERRALPNKE